MCRELVGVGLFCTAQGLRASASGDPQHGYWGPDSLVMASGSHLEGPVSVAIL